MITRIARNDVVRITRTGEVGTVKGWADHEDLERNGTILDVEVATGKRVQANGNALEFVADAKVDLRGGKLAAWWVIFLLTGTLAVWTAWGLHADHNVDWVWTVMIGWFAWSAWHNLLTLVFIKPRKTRVRLPKRETRQVRHPSQGR